MKKILITMAVLTSMVAGEMVFSSFTAPKQEKETEIECLQIEANVPSYWEGMAHANDSWDYLYLKVYQTEGQCNSFYAIITGAYGTYEAGTELWVKLNPDFESTDSRYYINRNRYYVSYKSKNYYFNM